MAVAQKNFRDQPLCNLAGYLPGYLPSSAFLA